MHGGVGLDGFNWDENIDSKRETNMKFILKTALIECRLFDGVLSGEARRGPNFIDI